MTILKDFGLHASPVDQLARRSFPGMAHFAGTGPDGLTCRQCANWDCKSPDEPKAACKKYKRMTNRPGNQVPREASACKYFVQR